MVLFRVNARMNRTGERVHVRKVEGGARRRIFQGACGREQPATETRECTSRGHAPALIHSLEGGARSPSIRFLSPLPCPRWISLGLLRPRGGEGASQRGNVNAPRAAATGATGPIAHLVLQPLVQHLPHLLPEVSRLENNRLLEFYVKKHPAPASSSLPLPRPQSATRSRSRRVSLPLPFPVHPTARLSPPIRCFASPRPAAASRYVQVRAAAFATRLSGSAQLHCARSTYFSYL